MIALAVATGIPAREWRQESDEAIVTALRVLHERNRKMEG